METKARNHIVITGTGRAGTTFAIHLLTVLGFDTGFKTDEIELDPISRAGLEKDIRGDNAPYVIKNPWFYRYGRSIYRHPDIKIDHMFVCIRDLREAAESRRRLYKQTDKARGLFGTGSTKDGDQEQALLHMFYKLMRDVSVANIPVTLIKYPKLVKDSKYLYGKLEPILKDMPYAEFDMAFNSIIRPEWVRGK